MIIHQKISKNYKKVFFFAAIETWTHNLMVTIISHKYSFSWFRGRGSSVVAGFFHFSIQLLYVWRQIFEISNLSRKYGPNFAGNCLRMHCHRKHIDPESFRSLASREVGEISIARFFPNKQTYKQTNKQTLWPNIKDVKRKMFKVNIEFVDREMS